MFMGVPFLSAFKGGFALFDEGFAAFGIVGAVEATVGGIFHRFHVLREFVAGGVVDRELAEERDGRRDLAGAAQSGRVDRERGQLAGAQVGVIEPDRRVR